MDPNPKPAFPAEEQIQRTHVLSSTNQSAAATSIRPRSRLMSEEERVNTMNALQDIPDLDKILQLRRNVVKLSPSSSSIDLSALQTIWTSIYDEAKREAERDAFVCKSMHHMILKHDSFGSAMTQLLAEAFQTQVTSCDEWVSLISTCYRGDVFYEDNVFPTCQGVSPTNALVDNLENNPFRRHTAEELGLLDIQAQVDRDPSANRSCLIPFLHFKGFKSLQGHRIAHILWRQGRKHAAMMIQSRISSLWGVDIHPAAKIGSGMMIDHGTGVVVGETAVIGNNCSFLHGVTLGSSGKDKVDRHPKLGNDVLVGCGTTILGNIWIGNNTKIGSGSIVLKSLPCCVTAVGNPARIVGTSKCLSAASEMDLAMVNVMYRREIKKQDNVNGEADSASGLTKNSITLCPRTVFSEVDKSAKGKLNIDEVGTAIGLRFGIVPSYTVLERIFSDSDADKDGYLNYGEYEIFSNQLISYIPLNPDAEKVMEMWKKSVAVADPACRYLLADARLLMDAKAGISAEAYDDSQQRNLRETTEAYLFYEI